MTQHLPIHAGRSPDVVAYARVDKDDYARLAAYRWVIDGPIDGPGAIYRARRRDERAAHAHRGVTLSQEVLPHSGHISFRNGNRLDFRRANLITPCDRKQNVAQEAERLRQMNGSPDPGCAGDANGDGAVDLPLTRDWTAWIDAEWADRLGRYGWRACMKGRGVYALRQIKRGGVKKTILLTRVIAGLQDLDSAAVLRPGVVAYRTPPDLQGRRLDLRRANLIVTTRGGVNLRRPRPRRYRGVQAVGRTGRYRATIRLGGQDLVLGMFDTAREAAHARDAEIVRLGLQGIARLNHDPM